MAATSATEIPKSPYSVLFSIPGTKAFCASGALARLPYVDDEPLALSSHSTICMTIGRSQA